MAAGLTVSTLRRKDDINYTSAAVVVGLSDIGTLTRDYDIYDPSLSVAWDGDADATTVFTPGSETGTIYSVLFDGTYYKYQEFTYNEGIGSVTEVTANKLGHTSAKYLSLAFAGAIIKATPSAAITGTAKFRLVIAKG